MADVGTYAQMAQAVYGGKAGMTGWHTLQGASPAGRLFSDGFRGAVFKCGTELVFAFAGTEGRDTKDLLADAKLAVGMNTRQYNSATRFVQPYLATGASISLCGHSLGGAIAQVLGNRMRLPFVTFNAPGVALFSKNFHETAVAAARGTTFIRMAGTVVSALRHPGQAVDDLRASVRSAMGVNFVISGDVVGCSGVHYGKVIRLRYTGDSKGFLPTHGIQAVIDELKDGSGKSFWRRGLGAVAPTSSA